MILCSANYFVEWFEKSQLSMIFRHNTAISIVVDLSQSDATGTGHHILTRLSAATRSTSLHSIDDACCEMHYVACSSTSISRPSSSIIQTRPAGFANEKTYRISLQAHIL